MKILHVYGGNLYGGVERMLYLLARDRAAEDDLVQEFALVYGGRLADELTSAGVNVYSLGPARVSRPWQIGQARRRLRGRLETGNYDVMVHHSWWPYAVFGPASRRCGVGTVLWVHDAIRRMTWLERWATVHAPDLIIANSQYTAASLGRRWGAVPVAVVPCLVSLDPPGGPSRLELRAENATAPGNVVILQASRLEEWKGHELHLRALATLGDLPQWTCWMTAWAQRPQERRYLARLRALASQLGIADRVRWLPEARNMGAVLRAADIYCQPNTAPEPFGMLLVEALLSGLPVVASASGGALEIVTPDCGLLTAAEPTAVSAALRRLIEYPEWRAQLAGAGPARGRRVSDPTVRLRELAAILKQHFPTPAGAAQ